MDRDELQSAVLFSEDVATFATPDELAVYVSHSNQYDLLVRTMNQAIEAAWPLADDLRRRLLDACEMVDALFPPQSTGTSVSAIVLAARRCISEGIGE